MPFFLPVWDRDDSRDEAKYEAYLNSEFSITLSYNYILSDHIADSEADVCQIISFRAVMKSAWTKHQVFQGETVCCRITVCVVSARAELEIPKEHNYIM